MAMIQKFHYFGTFYFHLCKRTTRLHLQEGDKTEAEDGSEAAPEEPQESEEVKQIRELIQVAMGSELKQVSGKFVRHYCNDEVDAYDNIC